jgi:hypothetical protein
MNSAGFEIKIIISFLSNDNYLNEKKAYLNDLVEDSISFFWQNSPAAEKTHSEGTLFAGIQKYRLESIYNVWYFSLLFSYHFIAS